MQPKTTRSLPPGLDPQTPTLKSYISFEPGWEDLARVVPHQNWNTLIFDTKALLLAAWRPLKQSVRARFNWFSLDGFFISQQGASRWV